MTPADAERLARYFQQGADYTQSARVQRMLDAEKRRLHRAFAELPVEVVWVDHDPYGSYQEMRDSVLSSGKLAIWTGASDVPMWDPQTNWMARAVHDWDHISNGFDFSQAGEYEGFRSAARKTPGLAPLYLSEIALQASVFNVTGAFVEAQKIVLLEEPDERWATSLAGLSGADPEELAEHVPMAAMLMAELGPDKAAMTLGSDGRWSEADALLLLEAGAIYNAVVAGQLDR